MAKRIVAEEIEVPSIVFNDFLKVRDFCKDNNFPHPIPEKSFDMTLSRAQFKYFNKYHNAVLGKKLSIEFALKMFNLSKLG